MNLLNPQEKLMEAPPTEVQAPLVFAPTWNNRHDLLRLVLETTRAISDQELHTASLKKWGVSLDARQVLAVLCFEYLVGVFSSQAIENNLSEDVLLRGLIGSEPLDWLFLHRFRHDNRALLQHGMERVYWDWIYKKTKGKVSPYRFVHLDPISRNADTSLSFLISLAVEKRIDWATQLDSMDMDD